MFHLPSELITIIKHKVYLERKDLFENAWIEGIIPWMYTKRDDHEHQQLEYGNMYDREGTGAYTSTFMLTAIKRISKAMHREVRKGNYHLSYDTHHYRSARLIK